MPLPPTVLTMRDLLLKAGVVDEYQLRSALAHLEQWGGRLPRTLTELGMVDEAQVSAALATALRLPLQPLGAVTRDAQALARLDAAFCEEHGVFPVSLNARTHTLVLAMADPTALDVVDLVAARAGARVQVVVAGESEVQEAVNRHYRHMLPTPLPGPNLARRAVTADLGPESARLELVFDDRRPPRASDPTPPPPGPRVPSANTLLDELLYCERCAEESA